MTKTRLERIERRGRAMLLSCKVIIAFAATFWVVRAVLFHQF
jgi:hypothetical protein